jgi:Uma2 family endonuclease
MSSVARLPQLPEDIFRVTVAQYDRLVEDGVLTEDDQIELIDGILVKKMSRNRPHVQAVNKAFWALSQLVPAGFHLRKEDPVVASDLSKPEPDLMVVRGEVGDYDVRDVTSGDVSIVVEIAESSLAADRTTMGRIYGAGNIPIYWIVNLINRRVEVFRDPSPEGYADWQIVGEGDSVPVVIDGNEVGRIAVNDILPNRKEEE